MHHYSPTETLLFIFVCMCVWDVCKCFCVQVCGFQDLCMVNLKTTWIIGPHLPPYLGQDICFAIYHWVWKSYWSLSFQRTSVLSLGFLELKMHSTAPDFAWTTEIQTLVLTLVWQEPCSLGHLPGPWSKPLFLKTKQNKKQCYLQTAWYSVHRR